MLQLFGLVPPLTAGLIVGGWRAVATVLLVMAGAVGGWAVWRRIGRRGRHMPLPHLLWMAVLLACLLPAHLAANALPLADGPVSYVMWPILPAGGLMLVGLHWLLGGTAGGRISPVVVAFLLLLTILGPALSPRLSLRRDAAVTGELFDYQREPLMELAGQPWAATDLRSAGEQHDATWRVPASQRLSLYTSGIERPDRLRITLLTLLRDAMPPMEDLIVLGQPAAIGMSSAVAVVAGGLFLIFRGVAEARISLVCLATAYAALLVLPVPESITTQGPVWTFLPALRSDGVRWDAALTFVHYELLAGPILFISLFLAPLPSLRPLDVRWRMLWAALLGPMMAASQLYGSVAYGPFIALFIVGLTTPFIDRITQARTIL